MDVDGMEDIADDNSNTIMSFRTKFEEKVDEYDQQHRGSKRKPWTYERTLEVIAEIKKAQEATRSGQRKSAMDYYWMGKYDVMNAGNEDYLVFKKRTPAAPTVRIIAREQYYDVLLESHKSCGHGGRDKMLHDIKNRYYIPKKAVEIFVSLCPVCETKRNVPRKGIVIKPIVSPDFDIRGQVDLIDFQSHPDGEFKWLLNYQDNATKFLNLRPLKTKEAVEVAAELMKIFLLFGAPYILQSDNGREFAANVIKELAAMWPECKIVHGRPQHPQTRGSSERSNQDVENMLRAWMTENNSTNWSVGCSFVQYSKNASFHTMIGRSPYKALFGSEPKAGLNGSNIPTSILSSIETEEQLKAFTEPAVMPFDSNNHDKFKTMDNVENLESNFTCGVCHNEATRAQRCEACKNVVHAICEITIGEESYRSNVVCKVEHDVEIETDSAQKGLKRAADNVIATTVIKQERT